MKTFFPSLLLAFSLLLLIPAAMLAQNTQPRHISVTGEGIVRVDPDKATVRIGVVNRADDAETAQNRTAEATADVIRRIRALGIPEDDIQLEVLTLHPVQEWDEQQRRSVERGYEAMRQVRVEVRDLSRLPRLVSGTVQQGANRLMGITYDLENRDASVNLALQRAVQNAREKARSTAEIVGTTLGEVWMIEEQQAGYDRPMYRMEAAMAADASGANPGAYAAGQIEIRAQVRVAFLIQ